jgi:hypothetical protein
VTAQWNAGLYRLSKQTRTVWCSPKRHKKKTIKETSACELDVSALSIMLMRLEAIRFNQNILKLERSSFLKQCVMSRKRLAYRVV